MSSTATRPLPDASLPALVEDKPAPWGQIKYRPLLSGLTLAFSDLCTLTLAVVAGSRLWLLVNPRASLLNPVLLLLPVCCLVRFVSFGHYPGFGCMAVEHLRRTCRGITMVYLLFTAAMFLAKDFWANSRGTLLLGWILSLLLAPAGGWLVRELVAARFGWGVPVLIIGAGQTARAVIRSLEANRILGYRPVACLDDDPAKQSLCEGVPVVGSLLDAGHVAARCHAQYAMVAIPGLSTDRLSWHLRRWRRIFPKILIVPPWAAVTSLWTEPRDLGGLLGLEMRNNLLNIWNQRTKRALDVVVSAVGMLALAPLVGLCALWIRKASPGAAFYTQQREGRDGHPISVLKLRTMYPNAEQTLQQHLADHPSAREEWDRYCKLKRDPRILPGIGHFLRETSLDELPQLWNVLKGEMSLVGPRPFPEYHNSRFDPELRRVRTQVTPGITGLWQVSARSDGDLETQAALDSYYIRNWSLWLDLYILIRTVRVVITQEGSY